MKKKRFFCVGFVSIWVLLLGGMIANQAQGRSIADFYAKNMVTLYCVSRPGGGGDFAARVLASYWTEATGGAMVVKNMPGAGGLKGINYLYTAKPDGLTIGLVDLGGQMLGPYVFKQPGVQYDIHKVNWLSVFAGDPYTFVVRASSPYGSIKDLKGAEGFKFGTVTHSGTDAVAAALLAEALQMKDASIIPGYRGTSPIGLAMGRSEIDGAAFNHAATISFMNKGFSKPPFAALWPEKVKELADVPLLTEVTDLSPEAQTLLRVFYDLESSKVIFAPPGVSQDKAQFVRESIDRVLALDAFKKQMGSRFVIWIEPTRGKDVDAKIRKLMAISPDDVAAVDRILKKYVK